MSESKMERAVEIIIETCWDGDMELARSQRLELYNIAGLDAEQLGKITGVLKKDVGRKHKTTDENASYSSLVESSGF